MKKIFYAMALVTALTLVGCGSDKQNAGNGTQSPPATGTPAPQPGNQCTFHNLQVNDAVFYSGPKGGTNPVFTDDTKSYLGTVLQIVPDGGSSFDVQVNFDNGVGKTWLKINLIQPQGVCTPPIAGLNIRYVGSASANFPTSSSPYLGKAVAAYAGGFIEVAWSHLTYHTVEPIQNILFYQ